jgi:hypothetical protein
MARYVDYTVDGVTALRKRLGVELQKQPTLEAAAQVFVSRIFEEFTESTALIRLYAALPYASLPPGNQSFVAQLADRAAGMSPKPQTPVLSLVGTRGARPEWNDRRKSQGHVGIPLVNRAFVAEIPMVARLMHDLGLGLDWLATADNALDTHMQGRLAGLFFVDDARTAVDEADRKIVPAQDFVESAGVHTVFGMGGGFITSSGVFVALIVFTRERLSKEQARIFMPLINALKTATVDKVGSGRYFDA